jgi:hypothetical protein
MNTITLTFDQLLHRDDVNRVAFPDAVKCEQPCSVGLAPRYVIVRGTNSGVFCGVIVSEDEKAVELTECRHIWYWKGAANTAEMALSGVSKPAECKFLAPVKRLRVKDAVEVIDCTEAAEKSLRAVSEWSVK